MIVLSILRHAKSSWDDSAARDIDRPLNGRGRAAAERMGRELKQRGVAFDHVLASPAARVRETLDLLSGGYGDLPPARFDDSLYGASEQRLLEMIQALPGEVRTPLIVGHNPGLHSLVLALTSDDEQGFRRLIAPEFPTAAFAAIKWSVEEWNEVGPGTGQLRSLILPRELD